MWQYLEYLPLRQTEYISSLGEGDTPLIASYRIGAGLGIKHLYFKLEFLNPTGSYKDRFASLAISLMRERGDQRIIATSSGNTGAALAGYAARFGLELDLYVLENTPEEKVLQACVYGAHVFRVKGFGISSEVTSQVIERLRTRALTAKTRMLISANCFCPSEMQGVKTISYEIWEQLKRAPDSVFIPVGGGGLFSSCYQGFLDYLRNDSALKLPRLHAVQPQGCATVVGPLLRGETQAESVECTSRISGLQVARVLDGQQVLEQVLLTQGTAHMPSDEVILRWQQRLVQEEGIYTEPAGAVALAGLASAVEQGQIGTDEVVVCLVTGGGFKDLQSFQPLLAKSSILNIDANTI